MKITTDWHIHTPASCDCRNSGVPVAELLARAAELGLTDFGITDHIHTPYNLPDLFHSEQNFWECNPPDGFHFGVEASCVSQWELDQILSGAQPAQVYGLRTGGPAGGELAISITQEDVDNYGFEYVIGGCHWPMYVPMERGAVIRDYHRQNMFLAGHPLVDIVAHPWWWMGHWQGADGMFRAEPWFDDFRKIPQSMHDEFAASAKQHNAAVEINLTALLFNKSYPESFVSQYLEYIAFLKGRGVKLSIGSDAHGLPYGGEASAEGNIFDRAGAMLERIGVRDEDMFRLPKRLADAPRGQRKDKA